MAEPHVESQDELAPTVTAGYKAPAMKTVEELEQLDQEDESLRKWKESLGLKAGATAAGASGAGPNVVVESLSMEITGRDSVVLDLTDKEKIGTYKKNPIIVKEGVEYRLKIQFRVNHQVVSGLKYLHVVKRKGIKVEKKEEMIGSYGPNEKAHERTFPPEEAPSGLLARGVYDIRSRFIDDDNNTHLEWDWALAIRKDWE